ncbi:hypothetical protein Droror1_Dr00023284 [Drosera rotundifolia]
MRSAARSFLSPPPLLRHLLHFRHLSTTAHGGGSTPTTTTSSDAYFALIHHISAIVRTDHFLERTLNKLRSLPSTMITSDLVFRVLRSCHLHGSPSLRFFLWARSHSPNYTPSLVEYQQLIETLARTRRWNSMWTVIKQLVRDHDDENEYSLINDGNARGVFWEEVVGFVIKEYGKEGMVDEAVKVFNTCEKVFKCKQTVKVYDSLLFALCEVRCFHGAYALVRRMIRKGVRPDKETYGVLVDAWCRAGKLREAMAFLEEMSSKGFNPPVRGRDLLVEGLLNAGYVENARGLVRKMTKEGFVPDVGTFNKLLEAVWRSGEGEFCVELYGDVCRMGLCPNLETYKIMIPGVAKLGKIDEVFRLLHCSMEDGHKPFPSLYAPILKALCREGRFDDAFSFFSDMKVRGHPPNRPVYTMMIRMCVRGGRFVEAANYLVEMMEFGLVPLSRNFDMVTDGLKNCGKHDLARRIEQLEVSLRGN